MNFIQSFTLSATFLWAASYAGRTALDFRSHAVCMYRWMYVWIDDVGFSSTFQQKKVNLSMNTKTDFHKTWVCGLGRGVNREGFNFNLAMVKNVFHLTPPEQICPL